MKVLFLLLSILWTSGAQQPGRYFPRSRTYNSNDDLIQFQPGRLYRYDYTVEIETGVPDMTEETLGMVLNCDLLLQVESQDTITMQIRDVMVDKVVQGSTDEEPRLVKDSELERDLSKPVTFRLQNGEIRSYTLDGSDPVWSRNVKRTILENLQIKSNMTSNQYYPTFSDSVYNTMERGVNGECEVWYQVDSIPSPYFPYSEDVLNVTKNWNYENCKERVEPECHNLDFQGCPRACRKSPMTRGQFPYSKYNPFNTGCPYGYEQDHFPMKLYSFTRYNITNPEGDSTLEELYSEGKISYKLYDRVVVHVINQNMSLDEIENHPGSIPSVSQPVTFTTLDFELPDVKRYSSLLTPKPYMRSYFSDPSSPSSYPSQFRQDVSPVAQQILANIARDLVSEDPEQKKELGERLIRLLEVLRTMDITELDNLWTNLESRSASSESQEVAKSVFLDVLPVAGTRPAVRFIAKLIEKDELTPLEIHEIVKAVPKNVIDPNEEIVEDYRRLCHSSKMSEYLQDPMCLTYASLVREACVLPQFQPETTRDLRRPGMKPISGNHVPFTRSAEWEDPQTRHEPRECSISKLLEYIEEIARKLTSTSTLHEKVRWVKILGHIGHAKVLEHLKPYVTGDDEDCYHKFGPSDCNFIRSLAIEALHRVTVRYPLEVQPLVADVFFNKAEPYELRAKAFSVLLETKPSLALMEKVATHSWWETNNQVGSFVYSALDALANISMPCMQRLSTIAEHVLPKVQSYDELGLEYSQYWTADFYHDVRDYGIQAIYNWVSSNFSDYSYSSYFALKHNIGPFVDRPLAVSYNLRGLDDLLDSLQEMGILEEDEVADQVKEYFNKLSIVPRTSEEFKLSVHSKIFYNEGFHFFDKESILRAIQGGRSMWNRGSPRSVQGHFVKVFMPASIRKVVLTDLGIPAVMTADHPLVLSLKVNDVALHTESGRYNLDIDIHPTVHYFSRISGHVLSPFTKRSYGTQVKTVYQLSVPLKIEVTCDLPDVASLELKPMLPHQVFYHKTEASLFSKIPLYHLQANVQSSDKLVIPIRTLPLLYKHEQKIGHDTLGVGLRTLVRSDDIWSDIPVWDDLSDWEEIVDDTVELLKNPGWNWREVQTVLESDMPRQNSKAAFIFEYKDSPDTQTRSRSYSNSDLDEELDKYYKVMLKKLYEKTDSYDWHLDQRFSSYSRQGPMQRYTESDTSGIFSFAVKADESQPPTFEMAMICGETYDGRADHFHFIVRQGEKRSYSNRAAEICGSALLKYPEIPNEFYYPTAFRGKAELAAELEWGPKCDYQPEIEIEGTLDEFVQETHDHPLRGEDIPTWYDRQCEIDRSEGKSQSYACKLAIDDDSLLTKMIFNISTHSIHPTLLNATHHLLEASKVYFYPNMEFDDVSAYNHPEKVRVEVEYLDNIPDLEVTNIFIYKPRENIFFRKLFTPFFNPPSSVRDYLEMYEDDIMGPVDFHQCNLMEDYIRTFDNVTYEIPDDQCEYVLAMDCSDTPQFAVISSQVDPAAKTKHLKVIIKDHVVELMPTEKDDQLFRVLVNGQNIPLNPDRPHFVGKEEDPDVIITYNEEDSEEYPPVVIIELVDEDVEVTYDGINAKVEVDPSYRGQTCGLCGDYDGEDVQEFMGPEMCIYENSTHFASKYALGGRECSAFNEHEYVRVCPNERRHYEHPYSSDRSRPWSTNQRFDTKCMEQQTLKYEDSNVVCFSVNPFPVCSRNCVQRGVKEAHVGFRCLPHGRAITDQLISDIHRDVMQPTGGKTMIWRKINLPAQCVPRDNPY